MNDAERLREQTGAEIDSKAEYDIGYWARIADWPRPPHTIERQQGWDDADEELAKESRNG